VPSAAEKIQNSDRHSSMDIAEKLSILNIAKISQQDSSLNAATLTDKKKAHTSGIGIFVFTKFNFIFNYINFANSLIGGVSDMFKRLFGLKSDHSPARDDNIKVKTTKKEIPDFSGLTLTQVLKKHNNTIWTMKFSHDGAFLASGDSDGVIKVWSVGLHPDFHDLKSSNRDSATTSSVSSWQFHIPPKINSLY